MNVAIVEDDDLEARTLREHLSRYAEECGTEFTVERFDNAVTFLSGYVPKYDIVFMDIEMPSMDGMEAARRLREVDKKVTLVFVTNMQQYAVDGYEVDALDYILKPVSYPAFKLKLRRAVARVEASTDRELVIPISGSGGGVARLRLSRLHYVEVMGHHLVYHSEDGLFRSYGSLNDVGPTLEANGFARCNSCYLVNLRYVGSVSGFYANVCGDELKISQPRKKEFLKALNDYIGGGKDVPV